MKHQKLAGSEQVQLTELLVNKDKELKATLERAREQARVELKMDTLRAEVERQDCHIRNLQRQLKEAEQILVSFTICFFILLMLLLVVSVSLCNHYHIIVSSLCISFRQPQFIRHVRNWHPLQRQTEDLSHLKISLNSPIVYPHLMQCVLH